MYCTKCGQKNEDDFKFCIKCGTPLVVPTQTVNETQNCNLKSKKGIIIGACACLGIVGIIGLSSIIIKLTGNKPNVNSYDTQTGISADAQKDNSLTDSKSIDDSSDQNIGKALNSMTAWNMYSSQRQGTIGKSQKLNGGWKILSESGESYWVFKGNEFWWYKSYSDLTDNYWHGTFTYTTGKAGLANFNLNTQLIEEKIKNSNGMLTMSDVYSLTLTPDKIISGGVDKSSTNIGTDDWRFVWVLVNHGSEGIEGQSLNIDSSETNYYVKIKD